MRFAFLAVITWSAVTAAEPEPSAEPRMDFVPSVTLRAGLHHTHVQKDDGEPDGYGPKVELEASIRPMPYVIVGAVVGYSRYSSDGLLDGVTRSTYGTSLSDYVLGGRLYARPHWRVFLGVGLLRLWENEQTSGLLGDKPQSRANTIVDAMAGVNVASASGFSLQIAATGTRYSQFSGNEHVTSYGLLFGVTR